MGVDVEPEPANIGAGFGELIDVIEKGAKDALAAKAFGDVDALNPPEVAIAPIAPFVSDEQLADDDAFAVCLGFGNKVGAFCGIAQKRENAVADGIDFELALFGFQGHARVEIGDDGSVG